MIAVFSDYIRQIIFFIVFASFVTLILPDEKYRAYINIVMGFVVMFLVFEPIYGGIYGGGIDELITGMDSRLSQTSMKNSSDIYGKKRQALIEESFAAQMHQQIERLMAGKGYGLDRLAVEISPGTGELERVELSVRRTDPGEKSGGIKIKPVKIKSSSGDGSEGEDIKKLISDFYNLPAEHIHVTVLSNTEQ